MNLTFKSLVMLILATLLSLISCNSKKHNKAEIESAMKQYDRLLLKMDTDSIGLLYTTDGILAGAIGRDSIKKFLASFKNVSVLSQSSTTNSIEINKDTAIQKGHYSQTDLIAGKDTIRVKGEFIARWHWIQDSGWHLKQMSTKPIK